MRNYNMMLAASAMACMAPDVGESIRSFPNAAMVDDGQIALTAHNNGDGTWAVTAGPGGEVLIDGLPREKAINIVGAPTGVYTPANLREAALADIRVEAEQKLVDAAAVNVLKSDEEAGTVAKGLEVRKPTMPGTDVKAPKLERMDEREGTAAVEVTAAAEAPAKAKAAKEA